MIKVGDIVKTKNKEGRVILPAVVTEQQKKLMKQDGILICRAYWMQ